MLRLAARLRTLPRDEVIAAVSVRGVEPNGIRDVFDLAEALVQPDSVDAALARLNRPRLAALAVTGELADPHTGASVSAIAERLGVADAEARERLEVLEARLLLTIAGDAVHPIDAVTERLRAWPAAGLPTTDELIAPAPPALVRDEGETTPFIDRITAERAFLTVSSLAELIGAMAVEPARELSRGGLSLPDSKRLAAAAGIDLDDLPSLVDLAARNGLVARENGHRSESIEGENWLLLPTTERWARLVTTWRASLPPEMLEVVADSAQRPWGPSLREEIAWFYPAGGEWLEKRITEVSRQAEALGLATGGAVSDIGRRVLAGEIADAAATFGELVPKHVARVYLQHDLTVVSPGPLDPALDARLRTMADVEGRELAATYRISSISINRALTGGETAESLHTFLSGISLTGMPQPLEYLLSETASRYGRVRVGAADTADFPARSAVRSADIELIGTIAVDQSLSAVGLRQISPTQLVSRFAPEVVFWALNDARYPVAAEDAEGEIVRLRRHHVSTSAPVSDPPDAIAELVDRVRAADADGTEQSWLARQLESAARAKLALTVSVRMPGGTIADYLLEPTSVANGRMRARDRKADIERTLPLSAIAGIAPAPAGD